MRKTSRFRDIKTLALLIATTLLGANPLSAERVSSVLTSPDSYHHKHVSLVGILRGQGPIFELYENAADALVMTSPKSVYVIGSEKWRNGGPYDLRRARVTGIIDAHRHGVWGNPCSLTPDKIEVLSGPVAPWPDMLGIFRNEMRTPVLLRFGIPPTNTEFTVQPGKYVEISMRDNQDPTVRAFSLKGSLIANAKIRKRADAPYFDPRNAASYYRITDNKIEQVLPSVAKGWGWRR